MTGEEFYADLLDRLARYQQWLDLMGLLDQFEGALRVLDEGDDPRIEWPSDSVSVHVTPESTRAMLVAERTRIRSEFAATGIDPPAELTGGIIEEVTADG